MTNLRDQLIGTWSLTSYAELPVDGSDPVHPMTTSPTGLILYTGDGYMSAQLSSPDRKPFASGDWFAGTGDEYRDEASSYIAYSGMFHVDEVNRTLTHSMFVSLFPNWIGQTQPRRVECDGTTLQLETAAPIISGGRHVNSRLIWRRARPNVPTAGSSPPS